MWKYDPVSGLPEDRSYLECGLPPLLRESVDAMIAAWEKLDRGEVYLHWDCDFCNLQADINCAEVDQVISSEQAQYLREKYLRIIGVELLTWGLKVCYNVSRKNKAVYGCLILFWIGGDSMSDLTILILAISICLALLLLARDDR